MFPNGVSQPIRKNLEGRYCLLVDGELREIPDALWDTRRKRRRVGIRLHEKIKALLKQLPKDTLVYEGRLFLTSAQDIYDKKDNQSFYEEIKQIFPGWISIKLEDSQQDGNDRKPHAHVVWIGPCNASEGFWSGSLPLDCQSPERSRNGTRTLYGHCEYTAKPALYVMTTRPWHGHNRPEDPVAAFARSIDRYENARRSTEGRLPMVNKVRRMSTQLLALATEHLPSSHRSPCSTPAAPPSVPSSPSLGRNSDHTRASLTPPVFTSPARVRCTDPGDTQEIPRSGGAISDTSVFSRGGKSASDFIIDLSPHIQDEGAGRGGGP